MDYTQNGASWTNNKPGVRGKRPNIVAKLKPTFEFDDDDSLPVEDFQEPTAPAVNGAAAGIDVPQLAARALKKAADRAASQPAQPGWEDMTNSCGITDETSATFSDVEAEATVGKKTESGRYISSEEESNLIDIDQVLDVTSRASLGPRVVLYRTALRSIVNSGDQAVCICQLLFWYGTGRNHQRRLRKIRDGKFWIAKTYQAWGEETGLNERQARAAVDALVKLGYVERRQFIFYGTKMCHLRLVGVAIQQALMKASECNT
jgi:hypothetical protein